MPEILFRGKRMDNGEWIESFFWKDLWGDGESCYILFDGEDYKVDPDTVGLYTGLTDKNGVKIFDGDLLAPEKEDQHAFVYLVLFANGAFCIEDIMLYSDDYGDYSGELTPISVFLDECVPMEVVGNIHDNPDVQLHRVHVIGNIHDNPEILEG